MNLKRIAFLSMAAASLLFVACDKIDDNERLVAYDNAGSSNDSSAIQSRHMVLVEDYTGQECPNCPGFARKIQDFAHANNRVVMVALHNDLFKHQGSDFATDEANEYLRLFGINALPAGVVDRQFENGKIATYSTPSKVLKAIKSELEKPQKLDLFAKAYLSDSTHVNIQVVVNSLAGKNFESKNTKLLIWLTEDNVIGYQVDRTDKKEDFVHNHLFRGALNGVWGENYEIGKVYTLNAQLPASVLNTAKENLANLKIVAFVYNETNKSIIETIKFGIN